MADPQYVRLPDRLLSGNVTDVEGGTGWSISGLDVKPFPDDDEDEAAFVRGALRSGLLEEADAASHEAVQGAHERVANLARQAIPENQGGVGQPSPWNEAAVAQVAKKERRKLLVHRITGEPQENPASTVSTTQPEVSTYDDWVGDELKAELRNRDLPQSGSKKEMVARLVEDDRSKTTA